MEAPLPPLRPAAVPQQTSRADAEPFVERAREEAPAVQRSLEPNGAIEGSKWKAGSANPRQMAAARGKAAAPVAPSALDPSGIFFLFLIASAGAAAGITYRAIFGAKITHYRPPPRVKGVRAGRIASLASERAPRAPALPRPPVRPKRAPAEPTGLPNIAEEFRQMVRALESRAA
jgi:hypothetical protein